MHKNHVWCLLEIMLFVSSYRKPYFLRVLKWKIFRETRLSLFAWKMIDTRRNAKIDRQMQLLRFQIQEQQYLLQVCRVPTVLLLHHKYDNLHRVTFAVPCFFFSGRRWVNCTLIYWSACGRPYGIRGWTQCILQDSQSCSCSPTRKWWWRL